MVKKLFLFLAALAVLLTGCQSSRQIETASVIENVSVCRQDGQLCYTFYLLTDSEEPEAVTVPASSFEEARSRAEHSYIPHLSLAKLGLLLFHREVSREVVETDIGYISTQAYFSPVAHVALCDGGTLERLKKDAGARELIERQIDVVVREHPQIKTEYLSVFNSYVRGESFLVPLITCDGELKAGWENIKMNK